MNSSERTGSAVEVGARDEAFKLISHLHAQVQLICGEGMENFLNHNDEIKSNYLWSICDLAERSLVLLGRVGAVDDIVRDH